MQLVVSRAKKYCDQGIDLLDLINVGNEGLMQAIEKFDLDQSVKFSTYACFWIDGHIRNTIVDQGRSIRIPRNKYYSINKFLKLKEEIQVLEGKVSLEYLSRWLGVSVEKILQYEQYSKSLISIYSEMAEPSDLDCVDLDCMDFDEQLVDTISDEEQKTPEEICLDNMVREEVREDIFWALERLKNKEKWVIIEKYGFLDGEYKTSKQTALALYEKGIFTSLVSDRWIWQIEVSAMKRLRSDPDLKTYDPNSKNFGVPGRKSLNLVKRK